MKRGNRIRYLMISSIFAIVGFVIGLATMPIEAEILLKTVDGLAWLILEIINVLLIDFPMCLLAGLTFAYLHKDAELKDGVICGILFLIVIIFLIFTVGQLFAITEPIKIAFGELRNLFGVKSVLVSLPFLIFDFGMCMLGGVLGIVVGSMIRRRCNYDRQIR